MDLTKPHWLEKELTLGCHENWCMRRRCSTCGSFKMVELLTGKPVSNRASQRDALNEIKLAEAEIVVQGLRNCSPKASINGIEWMLYVLWLRWGEQAHKNLFPALEGTFAGGVLNDMRDHYAMTFERRRLHLLRQGVKKKYWSE